MIKAALDETGLVHVGDAVGFLKEFVSLAKLLNRLREVDHVETFKHSNVWEADVGQNLQLYEILFTLNHLDQDVRQLLQFELDRITDFDEACHISSGRAYALHALSQQTPCALAALPAHTRIERSAHGDLHICGTPLSLIQFYRAAPELGNFS